MLGFWVCTEGKMAYAQINIRDIDLNAITFALPNYSALANTNV